MKRESLWFLSILFVAFICYSNHFNNSFQFDDHHNIVSNSSITKLKNIPLFFIDPTRNSASVTHQGFRPFLLSTFAIDFSLWGLDPFGFHVTSFAWYMVLLFLIYVFLGLILSKTSKSSSLIAFLSTLFYAVHPVNADCVNYIVQRGEIIAACCILAGLILFIRAKTFSRFGLYLIPPLAGVFVKETAYTFPMLLSLYIFFYEANNHGIIKRIIVAIVKSLPGFIILGCVFLYISLKTPQVSVADSYGNNSVFNYSITQLYIIMDYIRIAFLPINLVADTDWGTANSLNDPNIFIGATGILLTITLSFIFYFTPQTRFISFGLLWFFITLLPTSSLRPLAEVRNNHRMFLPFIGLLPAIVLGFYLIFKTYCNTIPKKIIAYVVSFAILLGFCGATFERNKVWKTEASFWKDVILKAPRNGRAFMNYGLSWMAKGNYNEALTNFENALKFSPNYDKLHINLGIAYGALGRDDKAEFHFNHAKSLSPSSPDSYFYFARWKYSTGKFELALRNAQSALSLYPLHLKAIHLILDCYTKLKRNDEAKFFAQNNLGEFSNDEKIRSYAEGRIDFDTPKPTEEKDFVDLSLVLFHEGRFNECVSLAKKGLQIYPDSFKLNNNIAACSSSMKDFENGVKYARKALEINPASQLAKNNLEWAIKMQHQK